MQPKSLQDKNVISNDKWYKYKWDKTKIPMYLNNLKSHESNELISEFISSMIHDKNADNVCEKFYDYLQFSLDESFKKVTLGKKKNKFPCNAWFDLECKELKSKLNNFAKQYDISIPERWQEYHDIEINYKRVIQSKRRNYKHQQLVGFQDMLSNDPNEYWKYWKKMKRNVSPSSDCISIGAFVEYFKTQNEPPTPAYFEKELMQEAKDFVEKYKLNIIERHNDVIAEILNKVITVDEVYVYYQLCRLKCGKAYSLDGIVW